MGSWKIDERVTANFSDCGTYRYWLVVEWTTGKGGVTVIGLNPSKADLNRDDNTIRKCANWAKKNGYRRLTMLNCYPFRATKPSDMKAAKDPFGKQDPQSVAELCAGRIIVAWGAGASHLGRGKQIAEHLGFGPVYCWGENKDGSPLHPCYAHLGELEEWRAR